MSNAIHSPQNSREDCSVRGLIRSISRELAEAGCDSPAFSAWQLVQHVTGQSRTQLLMRMEQALDKETVRRLSELVRRRMQGEPLQYVLGEWEFMGLPFTVGEGVLIPRPETELLCETAITFLKGRTGAQKVLDLCAGSGAVGISVAANIPQAQVTAVEKSADAFEYLVKNIEQNHVPVQAVRGDVLCPPDGFESRSFDAVLSNPPYIPERELAGLQREVHHEPRMALDGGADGLRFYRAILSLWTPLLKAGGLLAVECGIGQGRELAALFEQSGMEKVRVENDLSGIDRVVAGIKKDAGGSSF